MSTARRRALKRQIAALSLECATIGPVALTGNGILTADQAAAVATACTIFISLLQRGDEAALRTAKGCNRPPAGAENVAYLTFNDFIRGVLTAGHCAAGITHDLALWGRQVVALNPNTFNAIQRAQFNAAMDQVILDQRNNNAAYGRNPGLVGPPMNQSQAMDWLIYHAAYGLLDNGLATAATVPGAAIVLPVGAATTAFNQYLDEVNTELAPEFRRNPNCEAFMSNRNRAATLGWKLYGRLLSV